MNTADLRVDGDRLWQRLEALGEIGAVLGPNGERGCARLALTDADRDGRDLVVGWMRDLGLGGHDRRGRQRRRHPRRNRCRARPPVMTGSHIDTVRTGGRFDGNLGVLAGLEVIETLEQHGIATAPPDQRRLLHRRGRRALLSPTCWAASCTSAAWRWRMRSTCARPTTVRDWATSWRASDTPGRRRARPPAAPHAFVELHIEQGPVLEDEGITIGAVTGVQGISWTELTITGQSAHAGTTPMRLRHDAGYVAAAITPGCAQSRTRWVAHRSRRSVAASTHPTWST